MGEGAQPPHHQLLFHARGMHRAASLPAYASTGQFMGVDELLTPRQLNQQSSPFQGGISVYKRDSHVETVHSMV